MNRNVESQFSQLPSIDIQRSIFDRSSTHKTSFNVGELIPFYIDEVLPGDTFKVTTSKIVRLQTMLTPVMDNLYLDIYYFFDRFPNLWTHGKEFFGENNTSAWVPSTEYQIPTISSPAGGFQTGTIADYLGLPVGVEWSSQDKNAPIALPFRLYARVADSFFRDENLTDPLNIPLGDANQTGSNGSNYINDVANGGKPFRVAKYHDFFTSQLPQPQKSSGPVTFPLISGNLAPVGTYDTGHLPGTSLLNSYTLRWKVPETGAAYRPSSTNNIGIAGTSGDTIAQAGSGTSLGHIIPQNLVADLSTSVGAVSINELRLAFQLQRYYEKLSRSGSRYTEYLRAFFGTVSPDATLQRPEYLGGNRIPINVHEITNTAQGEQDFLGDLGAMSVTSDVHDDFVHSFTEHGYVIGVCCLRYDHSYPQGLEKMWLRKRTTDVYVPTFANLGEQPTPLCCIYADSTTMNSDDVFGFQEAWSEYRFKPDRVSGEMRPGISNTLASWHFSDYYTSAPTLSDAWIREDKTNVDRTLAVTSSVANQAFADFYVKNICTRAMPMYSIPGLIDHN